MAERQKRYWMHRINGGENGWVLSYPLLRDHNLLSIGWSFMSSNSSIENITKIGIKAIDAEYGKIEERKPNNRYSLLRFIKEMKCGDIVLVPSGAEMGLYRVADNKVLSNESIPESYLKENNVAYEDGELIFDKGRIDLGFYRKVVPIAKHLQRSQYADEYIYRRMHTRQTNLNIDDLGANIEIIIRSYQSRKEIGEQQEYNRWHTTRQHSWPYHIFNSYESQMSYMSIAHDAAVSFTYSKGLGKKGVEWDTNANLALHATNMKGWTVKNWSDHINECDNFWRLNRLMALMSYFETYLEAIIRLSIESDPGLLVNAAHTVDGVKLLKNKTTIQAIKVDRIVNMCTKGEWNKRKSALIRLYGVVPESLERNVGQLDKMRKLRNNIGHAFGRNIKAARNYLFSTRPPMDRLSIHTFWRYHDIVKTVAHDLDAQIMREHIGQFQTLFYYHQMIDELNQLATIKSKVETLKRRLIENEQDYEHSKKLCLWAINYYDKL